MIGEEAKQACENATPRGLNVRFNPRREDSEIVNLAYERGQLGERIQKLENAIKADPEAVSDYHKGLWKIQLDAMEGYYNTLGERIKDFVKQTERK